MASSSTGLDPLRAHRQPNRTASPVKRPANDHQQACPDPCGAFAPWQEGQKGALFYLYFTAVAQSVPQGANSGDKCDLVFASSRHQLSLLVVGRYLTVRFVQV